MSGPNVVLPKGHGSNVPTEYEYKFVEVWSGTDRNSLGTANKMLTEGWEPVRECAMGGGGQTHNVSVLALLRRIKPRG